MHGKLLPNVAVLPTLGPDHRLLLLPPLPPLPPPPPLCSCW